MKKIKNIFKKFLMAYTHNQWETVEKWCDEDTSIEYSTAGKAQGYDEINEKLQIPDVEFNLLVNTVTNCMVKTRGNITTLWAIAHHLHAIDSQNEWYSFLYGGKYEFVFDQKKEKIVSVKFDLEYEYGNTILVSKVWKLYENSKNKRIITNESLYHSENEGTSVEEAVYKLFWAMDTMDAKLFAENSTRDIEIERAGVDGDSYTLKGQTSLAGFLERDKNYFDQNQYSINLQHIDYPNQETARITARHLSPGKTGNKHLGSNTKYTQFYNEIVEIDLVLLDGCWKAARVCFTRKENPVSYGYEMIEL